MDNYLSQENINSLLALVIIPLLGIVVKFLATLLHTKTKELQNRIQNDTINKHISEAEDIIATVVSVVSQTFVDSLKKSGRFNEESAREAFLKAKVTAIDMISQESIDIINSVHKDFGKWVDNKIEMYVNQNKASQQPLIGTTIQPDESVPDNSFINQTPEPMPVPVPVEPPTYNTCANCTNQFNVYCCKCDGLMNYKPRMPV